MATTKAQQNAVNRYIGKHYYRVNLTLPAASESIIKRAADAETDGKVNTLINAALLEHLHLKSWDDETEKEC